MHHHFDFLYSIPHYYGAIVLMLCQRYAGILPYFVRMRVCRRLGQGVLFLEIVHCDINRTGHRSEVRARSVLR